MSNEWFDYVEEAKMRFIERFAALDEDEHPDKAVEIKEARRLLEDRIGKQRAQEAINAAEDAIISLTGDSLRPIFEPHYRAAIDKIKREFGIE